MKLEQQVVSLELAKQLKELGVKQESLWWWRLYSDGTGGMDWHLELYNNKDKDKAYDEISAYTVAELGEMLPYKLDDYWYSANNGSKELWCCWNKHSVYNHAWEDTSNANTEANARAKMLIWLIENGINILINPKQSEER